MNKNIIMLGLKQENANKILLRINEKHRDYEIMGGFFNNKKIGYLQTLGVVLQFYNKVMIDARKLNKNLAMNMQGLKLYDAIRCYGHECDIYYFGMPKEEAKRISKQIIENKEQYGKCKVIFVNVTGETDEEVESIINEMEKITIK